jgi:hypothetical protein
MDQSQRERGVEVDRHLTGDLLLVAMNAVGKKIMEAFAKRTGR